jgi:hypothetical protein
VVYFVGFDGKFQDFEKLFKVGVAREKWGFLGERGYLGKGLGKDFGKFGN